MNWPTVLASLIGAGFFGAAGTIATMFLRRPMARAEVTEKLEQMSRHALDRMDRELTARTAQLDALHEQVASLPGLRARIRELESDIVVLRARIRDLESEIALHRKDG